MYNLFSGLGIEVDIKLPQNFLKIKETLTRIGVASKKDNTLYQSCHILHKRGKYAIMHFKELFILDGKIEETVIDEDDIARRNMIAKLLEEWDLLAIEKPEEVGPLAPMSEIKVIPWKQKPEWTLVSKYSIGAKKDETNTVKKDVR
jgi:hypothetical protein